MPFFDKIVEILGGDFVGKILDKIPDAGQKEAAKLEIQKELNNAAAKISEASLTEMKAYMEDTANARAMQSSALLQEDKFSKRFIYYLTAFLVFFGMIYIYMVTFHPIPIANQRMADTVLGFLLGTIFSSVLGFFYGSTKSSNDKTKQLLTIAGQSTTGTSQTEAFKKP